MRQLCLRLYVSKCCQHVVNIMLTCWIDILLETLCWYVESTWWVDVMSQHVKSTHWVDILSWHIESTLWVYNICSSRDHFAKCQWDPEFGWPLSWWVSEYGEQVHTLGSTHLQGGDGEEAHYSYQLPPTCSAAQSTLPTAHCTLHTAAYTRWWDGLKEYASMLQLVTLTCYHPPLISRGPQHAGFVVPSLLSSEALQLCTVHQNKKVIGIPN